jgi:hypothetical protein
VAFLAIAPVVLLALISIMMPLIAGRTVSMFAPHLMLIVSIGAVHLCRTFSLRAVAVLFLLSLNTLGFFGYRGQLHSPVDYAELATEALPNAQPADLWFIRKSWVTTPIFYYLDADRHTFVAGDYAQAILRRPCARVWVLGFEGLEPQPAAMASLNGHHHQKHVEARGIYADLYVLGTDDAMQDAGEAPDPNEQ